MSISVLSVQPRPVATWPRIHQTCDGGYVIQGRCLGQLRWNVVRRMSQTLIRCVGFCLLAAALVPHVLVYLSAREEGGVVTWTIKQILYIRWLLHDLFVVNHPEWGRAIYYDGRNPTDWHLLAVALLILALTVPLSKALAFVISVVLWPFLSCHFRITITSEHVLLHRWWGRATLPRTQDAGGAVSFRTTNLSALRPVLGRIAMAFSQNTQINEDFFKSAVLTHGLRNHFIVCPLFARRADQIVAACHYAFNRSRLLSVTSY